MELIPIIKICAILLGVVLTLTLIISYILYKIRSNNETAIADNRMNNNFVEPKRVELRNETQTVQYVPQPQFVYYTPQKQNYVSHKESIKNNKERFKIINEKKLEIKKMDSNSPMEKAFYYPGNYNSIMNPVNNIDFNSRYSSSSDNLHKLNFRN
ncbi:MAG: hypothetical protein STSR0008_16640 [Ignavibacterium sp.]